MEKIAALGLKDPHFEAFIRKGGQRYLGDHFPPKDIGKSELSRQMKKILLQSKEE